MNPDSPARPGEPHRARLGLPAWLVALGLAASVVAAFAGVRGQAFVNLDDLTFVARNPQLRDGFTWSSVGWSFSTLLGANWHPLTWLSYLLDVELFGSTAGVHKAVNVALHAANTVLLLVLLRGATGSLWRSALAAALFGLHPLHVESVAWVSERKDVLSTAFWLLACIAWVRWTRRPSRGGYALVAGALVAGLASKAMLITLPVALLLLDAWPLRRIQLPFALRLRPAVRAYAQGERSLEITWPRAVLEKAPLLAIALGGAVLAVVAQGAGGAVSSTVTLPFGTRLANAVLSSATYLGKAAWPAGLAALYPHPAFLPGGMPAPRVALSALALAGLMTLAAWQVRRRPHLAFGLAWFLLTLLPVLGILQVGLQGLADRYTYVPLIGPFVAVAWAAGELAATGRAARIATAGVAVLALLALAETTRRQVAVWQDDFTLFGHALAVTDDNYLAMKNLGAAYVDARRPDLGLPWLEQSARLMPLDPHTWMNLGIAQLSTGLPDEGLESLQKAARMRPGDDRAWFNLGLGAAATGRADLAAEALERLRALGSPLAAALGDRLGAP